MRWPLRSVMTLVLPVAIIAFTGTDAPAQSTGAQVGIRPQAAAPVVLESPIGPQYDGGRPRWVKWGLVGAAGGAIMGWLLSGTDVDGKQNVGKDAAVGAVFGFAIVGGAIALYDWVCKPQSSSERAGLC